ncbi:MAG: ComF family protein [Oscillatoria sp. PMC 1068.18]|nr:ComF family protein [Oscillatoria sp. PMC 1076.18]MEC4991050.1 ComF family protein [Oscillatoria sp. PMC 1068.18]
MWKTFLSLFLQDSCPLCDRQTSSILCHYCEQQLQRCQFPARSQCRTGEIPLFVWGKYGGSLKKAIAAFKYKNRPQLGETLGFLLGEAWLNSSFAAKKPKMTVVPIPLHPEKLRQRGFNQAELIARSFCQYTGYPLQPQVLSRVRDTEAMFGLNPTAREENVKNAFTVGKIPGLPVLLLDDIYTTGATVRAATSALQASRITVAGVAAIATTHS